MNLPESRHPYTDGRALGIRLDDCAALLKEAGFHAWLALNPQIPDEVLVSIETAILRHRR